MDIAWDITPEDLEALEIGANILGTGGGGNPYTVKLYARELLKQGKRIAVVDPLTLPDDACVVAVGGMGAPTVSIERIIRGDEFLYAVQALERHVGRPIDALISKEIGGSNCMRPMLAAALGDLPVVDGDGMGRAFPELQMCTFFIYGLPVAPAALCDVRHNVVLFEEVRDAVWLERMARAVTIQMGCHAAYAMAPWSGADIKRTAVLHTVTQARDIGALVRDARRRQEDPIPPLVASQHGQILFHGKIVDVFRRVTGGFARGTVTIEGLDADQGEHLTIEFQNENLIARRGDIVVCTVPDLICILERETATPINTELLRYGLRVTVLGFPAPPQLVSATALQVSVRRPLGMISPIAHSEPLRITLADSPWHQGCQGGGRHAHTAGDARSQTRPAPRGLLHCAHLLHADRDGLAPQDMASGREFVEAGGLMGYAPNLADMYRRAATPVDKILKGATSAALPFEQAMKFDLVLNLKTAQALGVTFPPTLLILVDEVIK